MSSRPPPRRPARARRLALALLALGAIASPAIASGCVAGFDPPSKINSLRVHAVTADKPYASPGDEVTFTMTYHDGLPPPDEGPRPAQIIWLGGCYNPEGDEYFGCYEPLGELFQDLSPDNLPPEIQIGLSPEFKLKLPDDIISSRPEPLNGPHYGIAYVFFAVCAGTVRPVLDAGGDAGSFPLGCFDAEGRRLGAESFVPGYTQIYAFADERTNANPPVQGLSLDDEPLPEDFAQIPTVERCPLSEDERRAVGCGQEDPYQACTTYDIEVLVEPDVAEIDVDATGPDGQPLLEVVWVDYYADQGDLGGTVKLVNDAVQGFNDDRKVEWLPPPDPGVATLWAVVHDARGGSSVVRRLVRVE